VTTSTQEKPVRRRPETGWARARRLRGRGVVRTWVPAVADADAASAVGTCPEDNIVRGED
jgi:hypothetical protein